MFDPYVGFIVALLHSLHILAPDKTILFLTDPGPIWTVVTSATVWWTVGFSMMLYIAAMQDIPTSVYEAADLDGASKARQLWSITIPLLAPTTFLILLLQILASFKVFGQVQLISGGGPGNMTRPLVEYIYDTGFSKNELGYASAMSYALFIVLVIVTVIQLWFQNRKGAEQ
jgi:multiple sugar transport system permease protein